MDDTTAALGNDVDVDASFGDILDVLNIALSVNMELSKGKYFVVFDPLYAQLEADFAGPGGGPVGGTIDVDMVLADLNVGYSINENFDIHAGARYYDVDYESGSAFNRIHFHVGPQLAAGSLAGR